MWIPNSLSGIRIVLALLFPFISYDLRLIVLSTALITEFLDGALARKFHWETKSGQILDPLADRLLAVFVSLTIILDDQAFLFPILLLLTRDFVVTLGLFLTLLFFKHVNIIQIFKPNIWGKLTTFLQYLVFYDIFLFSPPHLELIWPVSFLSVISVGSYLFKFFQVIRFDYKGLISNKS